MGREAPSRAFVITRAEVVVARAEAVQAGQLAKIAAVPLRLHKENRDVRRHILRRNTEQKLGFARASRAHNLDMTLARMARETHFPERGIDPKEQGAAVSTGGKCFR